MKTTLIATYLALSLVLSACETAGQVIHEVTSTNEPYTAQTPIDTVMNDPVFGDYGRLLFPVQQSYYSGKTLGELGLTFYSHIDPDATVEIANYFKDHAAAGETIFYDIYSDEEKAADPAKADTGLFFFRDNEGAPFAICNAGGAFAYVGAIHHAAFCPALRHGIRRYGHQSERRGKAGKTDLNTAAHCGADYQYF